jgi:sulfur carrier protein
MAELIDLQVNGESGQAPAGLSLQQVLVELGYEPRLVVVEFNGTIVPRAQWPEQPVAAGDRLEVVTIVGGG